MQATLRPIECPHSATTQQRLKEGTQNSIPGVVVHKGTQPKEPTASTVPLKEAQVVAEERDSRRKSFPSFRLPLTKKKMQRSI